MGIMVYRCIFLIMGHAKALYHQPLELLESGDSRVQGFMPFLSSGPRFEV